MKGFHDGELKKITYLLSQKMGITNLFLGRNFQYYIILFIILFYYTYIYIILLFKKIRRTLKIFMPFDLIIEMIVMITATKSMYGNEKPSVLIDRYT